MTLLSAYFSEFDFGRRPNLLLWGDTVGLTRLADALQHTADGPTDRVLLPSDPADGRTIILCRSATPSGLIARADGFEWILDGETLRWFAELVNTLVKSGRQGHQYLETNHPKQITVRVSYGEYPDSLRPIPQA